MFSLTAYGKCFEQITLPSNWITCTNWESQSHYCEEQCCAKSFAKDLKSDCKLPKICFYLRQWKPFKNDEKCFLFHVKNFFRSGQQISKIHILPNISRSKDSQTMKFGQLIEYNVKNIFLEKPCTQCGREASPRPFYKNQNWA